MAAVVLGYRKALVITVWAVSFPVCTKGLFKNASVTLWELHLCHLLTIAIDCHLLIFIDY